MAGCASGIIYIYRYVPAEKNQVKKIQVLKGHSKSINHLTVHAPYVLSASQDGKILIWRYGSEWELVKTCHAKSPVMHVAFNPQDINTFASAQDKTVKVGSVFVCKHSVHFHFSIYNWFSIHVFS